MPRVKPVGQTLTEAFDYSIRLEGRRGDLKDFELRRLEQLAYPKEGNYLLYLAKEMLVAEIERDYERFDKAADRFLQNGASDDLLINMSSITLFALNPGLALALVRRLIELYPDHTEGFKLIAECAWFAGDLPLCAELRERIERLGGEMEKDLRDEEATRVLSEAGVALEHYRDYVHGLHDIVRNHLTGHRDARLELDFEVTQHEDGHEGIVLQVFSNLESEHLDRLDDDFLEHACSPEAIDSGVSDVVTVLVRDIPVQEAGVA
ncbi:hypothetical protein NPJ88_011535 [Halomonas elongata]|uniref:hypothetical protein n=1 Tax=Halomonas elongata TaxID=2746 RepID=UPI00255A9C02|nr:hypothetical protein [Halomonas elongata]MDL4862968.1 hypothetical protein [Halomonas elongata]